MTRSQPASCNSFNRPMQQKSDLPFGSEFSPQQIDLIRVLEIAEKSNGDWRALEALLRAEYFETHATTDYNRGKLANNCKLGLIAYGLLTREGDLTDLGNQILNLREKQVEMFEVFARHILLNLKGLLVVQTVQDMHARGERVDLLSLRHWLEERGIHVPRGGKQMSTMRLWLEKAGIVTTTDWQIDKKRLEDCSGTTEEAADEASMLSIEQRAFLKALANVGGKGSYWSNEVEKLATKIYGVRFDEKNLPKSVLYPLRDKGYITLERGTKEDGRGAKPFRVKLTDKIRKELVEPLFACLESQTRPKIRPLLRKSLHNILVDVASADKHVKGLALEALAFYLMRLVDLKYIATRLRGDQTGGAEVDVIFEGDRLLFSRWQIQCKNTKSVSLDDVAKEVGLTFQMKSNVVMIVSTGEVGSEARRYAQQVMSTTNINIVLIESRDLKQIEKNPAYIADALTREAQRAMEIKKLVL